MKLTVLALAIFAVLLVVDICEARKKKDENAEGERATMALGLDKDGKGQGGRPHGRPPFGGKTRPHKKGEKEEKPKDGEETENAPPPA